MGEFFDDEEQAAVAGEKEETEDLEESYVDVQEIVKERNKIHHEMNVRIPEYNEEIGRLNLDLFGDPENPDWESKLDTLKEELEHPMTRQHPIADKTKSVIQEIKRLQIKYTALHKFYKKSSENMGKLLDCSIKMYIEDSQKYEGKVSELTSQVTDLQDEVDKLQKDTKKDNNVNIEEADKKITTGMVEDFMHLYGDKFIKAYTEATGNETHEIRATCKASFTKAGSRYFAAKHPVPRDYAMRLFDFLILSSTKKSRISTAQPPETQNILGPNQTQNESINEKTSQESEDNSTNIPDKEQE